MRSSIKFLLFIALLFALQSFAQQKSFPLDKLCGSWRVSGNVVGEPCSNFIVKVYYDTLLEEYVIPLQDEKNSCGGIYIRYYLFYNAAKKCYEALAISGNKTYRMQGKLQDGFLLLTYTGQEGISEVVIGIDPKGKSWNLDAHLIDPTIGVIPMNNLHFEQK